MEIEKLGNDLDLEEYVYGYSSPSQTAFEKSGQFQTALAGGVGSGKTHSLIKRSILLSFLEADNEGVLTRYTATDLETTTKRQFFEECPSTLILHYNKSENYVIIRSGQQDKPSRIWFRHIWEPRPDKKHLSGLNLGWIAGDQIEDWEEDRWNDLMARFRRQTVRRHYMFGILNPKGHNWCWAKWIKPAEEAKLVETVLVPSVMGGFVDSKRYRAAPGLLAIVAKTEENFFNRRCVNHPRPKIGCEDCRLAAASYVTDMRRYNPEQWVRRMVDSSFEEWAGKIYPEYDEYTIHNIDPFHIPDEWKTVLVPIDCGGDSPWAIPVMRIDPFGDVYVTNEYYQQSVLVREIAEWIKDRERSGIPDWNAARKIMDPENKLAMLEFAEHGLYCESARKADKLAGIYQVAGYLHRVPGRVKAIPGQRLPDGTIGTLVVQAAPRLWVFKTCTNWRREHSAWQWKRDLRTGAPTDKPEDKDDHCADATLYGLRVRPPVEKLPELDPQLEALRRFDQASYREAMYRDGLAGKGQPAQGMGEMFHEHASGKAEEQETEW